VVFLDVQPETIMARLSTPDEIAKRPLLLGAADPLAKLQSIRAERVEYYQQADVTVTVPADSADAAYATPEVRNAPNLIRGDVM
jgi:shikimate kinase